MSLGSGKRCGVKLIEVVRVLLIDPPQGTACLFSLALTAVRHLPGGLKGCLNVLQ